MKESADFISEEEANDNMIIEISESYIANEMSMVLKVITKNDGFNKEFLTGLAGLALNNNLNDAVYVVGILRSAAQQMARIVVNDMENTIDKEPISEQENAGVNLH